MKIPPAPHPWNLSPREAVAVQRRLAAKVRRSGRRRRLRWVAGLDAAFSPDGERVLAGVVLWDARDAVAVEEHVALRRLAFPYVPGLLSFREAPALLSVLRKLERRPDVLMCDGQGIAHPRRFGIASHLGVVAGIASVGCAKSRLTGHHAEPGAARGSRTPLLDDGEVIGAVLRTRDGVRPVYVSIGHRVDLETAVALVLDCGAGRRLPEPTRRADRLVAAARRELLSRSRVGGPGARRPRPDAARRRARRAR